MLVVATPREEYWAFGVYALLLGGVAVVSTVPAGYLAKRMVVEVPFVLFAALMPFIATGPRVDVGPLSCPRPACSAPGPARQGHPRCPASLLLGATTEPPDLLAGLERLRLPHQLVQIMGFMMRYLEVVTDELGRMRIARESRASAAPRCAPGRPSRPPPAPCSSGPTSAASASTSRCCRAATAAGCR